VAKSSWLVIAAALLVAACARSTPSRTAPSPATSPNSTKPSVSEAAPAAAASTPVTPQATPVAPSPVSVPVDSARVQPTDIARRAIEVFGDSATPTSEAAEASVAPTWDIDVRSYESTSRVEHYVQMFSGRARDRIAARLEAGTRYEAMIRQKMREGGIPEDMYYLALVESGFDPNAYSRAAAVGMWQFMASTARDMGMRVDWWVDERRDPFRSTTAAVRFLKGLREQFGSLYLAAAAYNGGPVRIARGLRRYADDLEGTSGDDLFFALAEKDYLRNETREYVPQLIAAALIAKDPERFGVKINKLSPLEYDSVRVGPSTPLAAVAHASDDNVAAIKELNPHVLRGLTPPRDSFYVRIPSGKAESFAVAFDALPSSERVGYSTRESKKGESLASIARRAGLTTRQLATFNPKIKTLKSGNLAPGQAVIIPAAIVAAAATSAPDPSIERYSSSRNAKMHVVRSGETLSGIAKKYHTSTTALMRANGLRRPLIFPGQSLVVGAGKPSVKLVAKPSTGGKKAVSQTPAKKTGAAKRGARS